MTKRQVNLEGLERFEEGVAAAETHLASAKPDPLERQLEDIQPVEDYVLVRRDDAPEKSAGGVFIPDQAKQKPCRGRVVAVGPGRELRSGKVKPQLLAFIRAIYGDEHTAAGDTLPAFGAAVFQRIETISDEEIAQHFRVIAPVGVKPGDVVIYGPFGGLNREISLNGETYRFVRATEIFAVEEESPCSPSSP